MTDLTITVAQVLPATDAAADFVFGIAGAGITAGQPVYLDTVAGTYKLTDANAVATAAAAGIALHGALAGQPIKVQTSGDLTLGAGAAPAVGIVYCVSAAAGGISPIASLTSLDYTTILGVGIASNKLRMRVWVTGQLIA